MTGTVPPIKSTLDTYSLLMDSFFPSLLVRFVSFSCTFPGPISSYRISSLLSPFHCPLLSHPLRTHLTPTFHSNLLRFRRSCSLPKMSKRLLITWWLHKIRISITFVFLLHITKMKKKKEGPESTQFFPL